MVCGGLVLPAGFAVDLVVCLLGLCIVTLVSLSNCCYGCWFDCLIVLLTCLLVRCLIVLVYFHVI